MDLNGQYYAHLLSNPVLTRLRPTFWFDPTLAGSMTTSYVGEGVQGVTKLTGVEGRVANFTGTHDNLLRVGSYNGLPALKAEGSGSSTGTGTKMGLASTVNMKKGIVFMPFFNGSQVNMVMSMAQNAAIIDIFLQAGNISMDGLATNAARISVNGGAFTEYARDHAGSYSGPLLLSFEYQSIMQLMELFARINYGYAPNATFGDILVTDKDWTNADFEWAQGYFSHKWGIQGELPASHPYKTIAP